MSTRQATTDQEAERDRARGALVGLAVGDALGTTLEFCQPGTFRPLTDMVGGGHFLLKKGYWTDDTSMALCLAHSLLASGGFDPRDQMQRYCAWLDEGYLSSIGTCFDVGVTVRSALRRFQRDGEPYAGGRGKWRSGNGSIMRLAPVPVAYHHNLSKTIQHAINSSRTTHGSPLCLDSCGWLAALLHRLLQGMSKTQALDPCHYPAQTSELQRLQQGHWQTKRYQELNGSGYVIDCLEAALWCFWHTADFASCVLAAANLGNDADTTAAVAGQLAGAFYGHQAIPAHWREALFMETDMVQLADALFALRPED